jgi:hypothetical protein
VVPDEAASDTHSSNEAISSGFSPVMEPPTGMDVPSATGSGKRRESLIQLATDASVGWTFVIVHRYVTVAGYSRTSKIAAPFTVFWHTSSCARASGAAASETASAAPFQPLLMS